MASTTWSDLPFELHLEMMHRLTQFDRYFFSQASWACRQLAEFPPKFSRPRLDPALVSHVFAQGYLSQLIWLKEHRVPFSDVAWHEAARNGRLEIFKWAHSNGETFFGHNIKAATAMLALLAASFGHWDLVQFFVEHYGYVEDFSLISPSIQWKQHELLEKLLAQHSKEKPINWTQALASAALYGDLSLVQRFFSRVADRRSRAQVLIGSALTGGQVEVLNWALAQNVPIQPPLPLHNVANLANPLPTLEWLRENHIPLGTPLVGGLIHQGDPRVVRWLLERLTDIPGPTLVQNAVSTPTDPNGMGPYDITILRLLVEEKGFAWDSRALINAAFAGNDLALKFLMERPECPRLSDEEILQMLSTCATSDRYEAFRYLLEKTLGRIPLKHYTLLLSALNPESTDILKLIHKHHPITPDQPLLNGCLDRDHPLHLSFLLSLLPQPPADWLDSLPPSFDDDHRFFPAPRCWRYLLEQDLIKFDPTWAPFFIRAGDGCILLFPAILKKHSRGVDWKEIRSIADHEGALWLLRWLDEEKLGL